MPRRFAKCKVKLVLILLPSVSLIFAFVSNTPEVQTPHRSYRCLHSAFRHRKRLFVIGGKCVAPGRTGFELWREHCCDQHCGDDIVQLFVHRRFYCVCVVERCLRARPQNLCLVQGKCRCPHAARTLAPLFHRNISISYQVLTRPAKVKYGNAAPPGTKMQISFKMRCESARTFTRQTERASNICHYTGILKSCFSAAQR